MLSVQFVNFRFGKLDKCALAPKTSAKFGPVRGVHVLHQIDTIGGNTLIQRVKCLDDVRIHVTSVVYDDVKALILVNNISQELLVVLAADTYIEVLTSVFFAFGVNVYPDNLRTPVKTLAPHTQRAASVNPNFQNLNRSIAKPVEIALIDVKIVQPLVQALFTVVLKVPL